MDNKDSITINIPIYYLLQIAVYGNMGTGELPDMIKIWAQKELIKEGYSEELTIAQKERLSELRSSLRNVIGDAGMEKIDGALSDAKTGLDFAMKLKNGIKQ